MERRPAKSLYFGLLRLTFYLSLSVWHIGTVTSFHQLSRIQNNSPFRPTQSQFTSHTFLMGVRGFRAWFESQFPDAVRAVKKDDVSENFDHVLIDVNPLIHVCLRKSGSDGHSFVLLMKQLDKLLAFATPKMSLVLAMDGPPGAAKLSTQRKRRFSTVVRSELRIKQIDKLLSSDSAISRRAKKRIKSWKRKRAQLVSDLRTMRVTPGTDYMEQAEQAVLYWAWQRLGARTTALANNDVNIFVSSSTTPGEGEVKLLEWIYNKPRRGESIAILGGDSDLVLEALVIPVASTHNVFVLLPEGNRHCLCVSIWETTRTLARVLKHQSIEDMVRVRSDVTLLLIMNGNDYLPKVKGSGGFNKLFRTYINLHRAWKDRSAAFLVDPATLEINLDFAEAFFGALVAASSSATWKQGQGQGQGQSTQTVSPFSKLHNLVAAHFLPSPLTFLILEENDGEAEPKTTDISADLPEDDDDGLDSDEGDDDDDDEDDDESFDLVSEPDDVRVRLELGEPGSDDFFSYEIRHPRGSSLKKAKHTLAAMALTDMLDEDDDSESEDETNLEEDLTAVVAKYDWELQHPATGDVSKYLYGLLWNLRTYQTGVSPDYGFNYGNRLSPDCRQILEFLQEAKADRRRITPNELQEVVRSKPFSAGISSLAALPSLVIDLVPHPFRELPPDIVEDVYGKCMDLPTNTFDFVEFERICFEHLENLGFEPPPQIEDNSWTLLSKTFRPSSQLTEPPKPFSDRMVELRPSRFLRLANLVNDAPPSDTSAELGPFLTKLGEVDRVDYRLAYQNRRERKAFRSRKGKSTPRDSNPKQRDNSVQEHIVDSAEANGAESLESANGKNGQEMATESRQQILPSESDGIARAVSVIQNLMDIKVIEISWSIEELKETEDGKQEIVRLTVRRGEAKSGLDIPRKELLFEAARTLQESRSSIKRHLALEALDLMTGSKDWRRMTLKELKQVMAATPSK